MNIIARLIFSGLVLTLIAAWGGSAEAAYNPRGVCKKKLRIWNGSVGWAAFATNRRGNYCAFSRAYPSKKKAISAVLGKCRSKRTKCRVIATKRPPRVARLRDKCRTSHRAWKSKPGYRAFALAKNGTWCSWSWGSVDLADARKKALNGCEAKHKCTIYSTLVPLEVLKLRQRYMKELGLYSGKIDAIWGRGTKRAMVTFARWADYPASDDDTIYDMLKWAVLITRNHDFKPKEAAALARRASEEKSLAFLNKGKTGPSKGVAGQFARDDTFTARLGPALNPERRWPHGIAKWILTEAIPAPGDDKPVCQLATEGLVLAHFDDTALGTVLFTKRTDMPLGRAKADVSFSKSKATKMPVRSLKKVGTHIVVPDNGAFLQSLVFARFLRIAFADGKGTLSFPVGNVRQRLLAFGNCVEKNKQKPTRVAVTQRKIKPSVQRAGVKAGFAQAQRNGSGQYSVLVEVNAEPVFMLVDTGASRVSIAETVAKRSGIVVGDADFKHIANTANGTTKVAYAVAEELRVGGIVMRDVKVSILRDKSLATGALLGMTFLNRLNRFEFAGDRLKLYQ